MGILIHYPKNYQLQPKHFPTAWIVTKAEEVLTQPIPHITDAKALQSPGGPHDFYSNGDYWWPNPETEDGLPYIRRDGQSNPDNFNAHRMLLRRMRTSLVYVTAAYLQTKDKRFSNHGVRLLKEFFLDEKTKMSPHLSYAQAIPGICDGRGIGIIDTLHLADVPFAIEALYQENAMAEDIYVQLKNWFSCYLGWLLTSVNGISEMTQANNHSVTYFVQAAAFARFTDNHRIVEFCRDAYKRYLLPQMAPDGSFPLELARTKPYNYSIFVLDNMVTLCHLLSTPDDNLWEYALPNGACIQKGLDFLTPYLLDKTCWPYPEDVSHFEAFPARASFMLFAGSVMGRQELLDLYVSLPLESDDEEARRNIGVRMPDLWL